MFKYSIGLYITSIILWANFKYIYESLHQLTSETTKNEHRLISLTQIKVLCTMVVACMHIVFKKYIVNVHRVVILDK